MSGVRHVLLIYCLSGGQPGGVLAEALEEGMVSVDQVIGLTNSLSGSMGSGSSEFSSGV